MVLRSFCKVLSSSDVAIVVGKLISAISGLCLSDQAGASGLKDCATCALIALRVCIQCSKCGHVIVYV